MVSAQSVSVLSFYCRQCFRSWYVVENGNNIDKVMSESSYIQIIQLHH